MDKQASKENGRFLLYEKYPNPAATRPYNAQACAPQCIYMILKLSNGDPVLSSSGIFK